MKWKRIFLAQLFLVFVYFLMPKWTSEVKVQPEVSPARINFLKPFNLVYCHISKNLNQKLNSLIVRARHDLATSLAQRREIRPEWERYYSPPNATSPFKPIGPADPIWSNKTIQKFAVIREPVDRFISAYLMYCYDLTECNSSSFQNCGKDPICILKLVQRITDSYQWHRQSFQVTHFAPQKFQCRFRQHLNVYHLLKYEHSKKFNRDLMALLSHHFPRNFLEKGWGQNGGSFLEEFTRHSTFERFAAIRHQLKSNSTIVNAVYRAYQMDYDMFQFNKSTLILSL